MRRYWEEVERLAANGEEIAYLCANWHDCQCDTCAPGEIVPPVFRCPGWRPRR